MCGIVGYVGPRDASPILMGGLRKLEYRGYDSAGLAVFEDHHVEVRRCVGKLDGLTTLLREQPLKGTPGIGHTRWATHGRPSEQNAHPHRAGKVVLIHNGIIENYLELRAALERRGRRMLSETDTEVISHLIDEQVQAGFGLGDGENFVASDIPALLEHTRRVLFLEDGEVAELTAGRVVITTFDGEPVAREPRVVTWD